ncbi:MAG: hypothetical protein ACREQ7_12475 [Candidatus Binatia bacterium]
MNAWESIFRQSPVNQGYYDEGKLPQQKWDWPRGTWFQARLDYVREHRSGWQLKTSGKLGKSHDLPEM